MKWEIRGVGIKLEVNSTLLTSLPQLFLTQVLSLAFKDFHWQFWGKPQKKRAKGNPERKTQQAEPPPLPEDIVSHSSDYSLCSSASGDGNRLLKRSHRRKLRYFR